MFYIFQNFLILDTSTKRQYDDLLPKKNFFKGNDIRDFSEIFAKIITFKPFKSAPVLCHRIIRLVNVVINQRS